MILMASVKHLLGLSAVASLVGATVPAWAAQPVKTSIASAATAQAAPKGNGGGGMSGPVLAALKSGLSGPAVAAIASKGRSKASPD